MMNVTFRIPTDPELEAINAHAAAEIGYEFENVVIVEGYVSDGPGYRGNLAICIPGDIGDGVATVMIHEDGRWVLPYLGFDEHLGDEPDQFRDDVDADADVLRSAGMGTDEDYGYFGEDC